MILNTVDEKGWGLGAVAVKQCVDEVVKCLGEDTCSEMYGLRACLPACLFACLCKCLFGKHGAPF